MANGENVVGVNGVKLETKRRNAGIEFAVKHEKSPRSFSRQIAPLSGTICRVSGDDLVVVAHVVAGSTGLCKAQALITTGGIDNPQQVAEKVIQVGLPVIVFAGWLGYPSTTRNSSLPALISEVMDSITGRHALRVISVPKEIVGEKTLEEVAVSV